MPPTPISGMRSPRRWRMPASTAVERSNSGLPESPPASPPRGSSATVARSVVVLVQITPSIDRKSTRLNSSHVEISYAVFCLKKKKKKKIDKVMEDERGRRNDCG